MLQNNPKPNHRNSGFLVQDVFEVAQQADLRQKQRMPENARFRLNHRVTYAECTLGNHVYYGRYLEMLEAARGEFLRHLGTPFLALQLAGMLFPVTECHLRYRAQAAYDDLLTIELWITLARGVRLNFAYRLAKEPGVLVLEAQTFHACTSLENKPKRLPPQLVTALQPYLEAASQDHPALSDAAG